MLNKHGNGKRGATSIFFLVVAVVTGYCAFQFLLENVGKGFIARASATIIAIGLAFGIYWLWEFLYSLIPSLRDAKTRLGVFGLALLATALIIAASANPNASAISGASAQAMAIDAQIVSIEMVVAGHGEAAHQLAGVVTDFDAVVTKLASDAKAEFDHGAISGGRGPGAVHTVLTRLGGQLSDLRTSIQTQQETAQSTLQSARDDLAAMRATSGLPLAERMQKVGASADALRAKLAALDTRPLAASVTRIVEAIPQEVSGAAVKLSNNADMAARQREALQRLRDDLAATTQRLIKIATALAQATPEAMPSFEPMTGAQAVRVHWRSYLSTWAIALALDLFPFFGLCLLLVTSASKSRSQHALDDLAHLSVQDLILSMNANDMLHGKPLDALRTLISGEAGRGKS